MTRSAITLSLLMPLLALSATGAAAHTVLESDLPDGDFQDTRTFDGNEDVVVLGEGQNEVFGSLSGTCTTSRCNDRSGANAGPGDFFKFDFGPLSTVVTDVRLEIFNVTAPADFIAAFMVVSGDVNSNAFLEAAVTQASPFSGTALGIGTEVSGVENLFFGVIGLEAAQAGAFAFDWRMSLGIERVQPVPAPPSLALFGLGLGVVSAARRRRTPAARKDDPGRATRC